MSKPTHPPVLPVGEMFKQDAGNDEWCLWFHFRCFCCEPISEASPEFRRIISALQRCAWLDLRGEDKKTIIATLYKAGVKPPRGMSWPYATGYELSQVCEEQAQRWRKWGKEAGE